MAMPAPRAILWTATLLAVGVVIAFVRLQPNDAPSVSLAIEPPVVGDDADARRDDGSTEQPIVPIEASETRANIVSTSPPPKGVPQNAEDLRASNAILAPIIEANERALAAEDKDPLWAMEMETRIVSEISQKALGLEITDLQVDCRTTLCRVDMTFALRLLQKEFGPVAQDAVWDGRQPVGFFAKALDLDFRDQVAMGLNAYGTPVFVGYVFKPAETKSE